MKIIKLLSLVTLVSCSSTKYHTRPYDLNSFGSQFINKSLSEGQVIKDLFIDFGIQLDENSSIHIHNQQIILKGTKVDHYRVSSLIECINQDPKSTPEVEIITGPQSFYNYTEKEFEEMIKEFGFNKHIPDVNR